MLIWSPREYNYPADHAVNAVLDAEANREEIHFEALSDALRHQRAFRLCFDGGMRSDFMAAVGVVLYAVHALQQGVHYELVARCGQLLSFADSAFTTEALALDVALRSFANVLNGGRHFD